MRWHVWLLGTVATLYTTVIILIVAQQIHDNRGLAAQQACDVRAEREIDRCLAAVPDNEDLSTELAANHACKAQADKETDICAKWRVW